MTMNLSCVCPCQQGTVRVLWWASHMETTLSGILPRLEQTASLPHILRLIRKKSQTSLLHTLKIRPSISTSSPLGGIQSRRKCSFSFFPWCFSSLSSSSPSRAPPGSLRRSWPARLQTPHVASVAGDRGWRETNKIYEGLSHREPEVHWSCSWELMRIFLNRSTKINKMVTKQLIMQKAFLEVTLKQVS